MTCVNLDLVSSLDTTGELQLGGVLFQTKRAPEVLVLQPRQDFVDCVQFALTAYGQLLELLEGQQVPFLLLKDAAGTPKSRNHPGVANVWHHDKRRMIGLHNPHETPLLRGPSFWAPSAAVTPVFLENAPDILRIVEGKSANAEDAVSSFTSSDPQLVRDSVKKVSLNLGLLARKGDKAAQGILLDLDSSIPSTSVDLGGLPHSCVFFSDSLGFHRSSFDCTLTTERYGRILMD